MDRKLKNKLNLVFREEKCPICGKKFIAAPQHVFKYSETRHICSYPCMQEYRRRQEKLANKKMIPVEMVDYDGKVIARFKSLDEASNELDYDMTTLRMCILRGNKSRRFGYYFRFAKG